MSFAVAPRWQSFHAVKRDNAVEEYEDAFAGANGRFAVADGASESSYAGPWARLLVNGFVAASGEPWRALGWLAALRKQWAAQVDDLPLPWYAETKRDQGAFATLLGINFHAPEGEGPGLWHALAVGDSCLFQMRAGHLLQSFPLECADDFNNHPPLLSSRSSIAPAHEQTCGEWQPGDRFLLMTDALAQWFLRQAEEKNPTAFLAKAAHAFGPWIDERRREQSLRNDDVTLLIVDL
jgi:hypothetical protein